MRLVTLWSGDWGLFVVTIMKIFFIKRVMFRNVFWKKQCSGISVTYKSDSKKVFQVNKFKLGGMFSCMFVCCTKVDHVTMEISLQSCKQLSCECRCSSSCYGILWCQTTTRKTVCNHKQVRKILGVMIYWG